MLQGALSTNMLQGGKGGMYVCDDITAAMPLESYTRHTIEKLKSWFAS